jgi:hypothetical protein
VLVDALKPNEEGESPLAKVLEAVQAKVPGLVVPEAISAANLTTTLGLLGSLVSKASAEGPDGAPVGPAKAVLDLVKGASAVAAASNSSNPLGSLLGALAPKDGNKTNPLAGLGNLVSAIAPQGADLLQKSDVLSNLLGQLSAGTAAAPQADLVGAVSKLLSGGASADGAPAADLSSVLSKLKSANGTDLLRHVMAAVSQGQSAADGTPDLAGILSKAQQFVSKDGQIDPSVGALLGGIKDLTSGGAGGAAVNPLAFLASGAEGKNFTVPTLKELASKAGPMLQQLSASQGADGGASPLANLAAALKGGEGGPGLAAKVGPLLQSLGAQGGAGGDPLAGILNAVGLQDAAAQAGQINWQAVGDALHKAGPALQSLSNGNPNLAGVTKFLENLRAPKTA